MAEAIEQRGVTAAAVLSGNRNFPGRVHGQIDHAFLASPPLVVAYGIAGTVEIDISREPLGRASGGAPVFLRDVWPTDDEIAEAHTKAMRENDFSDAYADNSGGDVWTALDAPMPRSSHGIRTRPTCAVRPSSHCRRARPGPPSSSPAR